MTIGQQRLLPRSVCTEASRMVLLAELGLVARMADGRSELGGTVGELALVPVPTVAVLTVRATELSLVASGIDHRVNRSCRRVILPTDGRSI